MAKRLVYSDRKKLIEAREKGVTDAGIKAQFGFTDDRTLKRHLRLAEQEQEARSVKIEILKDALASHLAEIRGLIEKWQNIIAVPLIYRVAQETSSREHPIESNPLFSSLKEHIPSPTLWRNYAIWADKRKEYLSACEKLRHEMIAEAEKWGTLRLVTPSFSEPIFKRLQEKVEGQKSKVHVFEKRIEYINVQGKPIPEYEILVVDGLKTLEAIDALAYETQYKTLSDQIVGSEVAANLIVGYNELEALGGKITKFLLEISLRRDYIMYSCKLCPGQTRLLR
jgi:hypothetical protein